jgi:beta-galactosidase
MFRKVTSLDFSWRFMLGDVPEAADPAYDDAGWRELDVPHDWSIEGPFLQSNPSGPRGGYAPAGIGWYRKALRLNGKKDGKRVFIRFEGIYMSSTVWINGYKLGTHPYGYTTLEYELTPYLRDGGDNIVAVRVDNSVQPGSRWYSGSGIYRHVWLVETPELYVPADGIFVTTPAVSEDSAEVSVRTDVRNSRSQAAPCTVKTQILGKEGNVLQECEASLTLESGVTHTFEQTVVVQRPELWTPDSPVLYSVRTFIVSDGRGHDEVTTSFGIRIAVFDPNQGFILNGKPLKLKGVCLHQDGGCVGVACQDRTWERQILVLKEMGCNAIRTSHNPPAPAFLDACDRLGMLVMDEAFDEWKIGKEPRVFTSEDPDKVVRLPIYAYHQYFEQWSEIDLTAMVKRDRNHPSVILWSIGNEIQDTHHAEGAVIARELLQIVRKSDPTRPVTLAMNNVPSANKLGIPQVLDVVGYNYKEKFYIEDHAKYPERIIVGSETRTATPFVPRGEYTEFVESVKELSDRPNVHHDIEQLANSIGQSDFSTRRVAERIIQAENSWSLTEKLEYAAGLFLWTGFDYIGEPSPCAWPSKSSYFGVIDTCGFPKDVYFLYQSLWSDKPVVYLMPHWNWENRQGEDIPVWCFTNCESVELNLNGKSLGVKRLADGPHLHLEWIVPYEPGKLTATGCKSGENVAVYTVQTAGKPAALRLSSNTDTLSSHGQDVAYITIEVVDAVGQRVPHSNVSVELQIEGEGKLVGVDNGHPANSDPYQGKQITTHNGLALAVVQSTLKPGQITVLAEARGLSQGTIAVENKQSYMD